MVSSWLAVECNKRGRRSNFECNWFHFQKIASFDYILFVEIPRPFSINPNICFLVLLAFGADGIARKTTETVDCNCLRLFLYGFFFVWSKTKQRHLAYTIAFCFQNAHFFIIFNSSSHFLLLLNSMLLLILQAQHQVMIFCLVPCMNSNTIKLLKFEHPLLSV